MSEQAKELQVKLLEITKEVSKSVLDNNVSIEYLKNMAYQDLSVIDNTIMNSDTVKANMNSIKRSCHNILISISGILHLANNTIEQVSKIENFTTGYPLDFKTNNPFINNLLSELCLNHEKRVKLQVCYEDSLYQCYSDFYLLKECELGQKTDLIIAEDIVINFIKNNLISIGFSKPEVMLEKYNLEFQRQKKITESSTAQKIFD